MYHAEEGVSCRLNHWTTASRGLVVQWFDRQLTEDMSWALWPLFLLRQWSPGTSPRPHCSISMFATTHFFTYCRYRGLNPRLVVVVVVVDSHVQRIVLATEENTVTQQVSHRPIKCQSRLWSQRGTKVNGSHHGDNPLLGPTGIQIAKKSYATVQAMACTDQYQNGSSNLLTPYYREQPRSTWIAVAYPRPVFPQQQTGQITLQPVVLINKSKFLKATHCRKIRKLKYRGP